MTGLTTRQRDCLGVIAQLTANRGVAPSFKEIGDALGLASKSGVHRLIHGLAERGHIHFHPERKRSIALARNGMPIPFDDMAAAVAEEFFGADEIKFAQVRRVLIQAWGGPRQ